MFVINLPPLAVTAIPVHTWEHAYMLVPVTVYACMPGPIRLTYGKQQFQCGNSNCSAQRIAPPISWTARLGLGLLTKKYGANVDGYR